MRPLTFWGYTGKTWTRTDALLAQALTVYEDDLHACGHPRSRAMHPEMDGAYEVDDDVVCYACQALDEYREEHKGKVAPGTVLRVIDTEPDAVLPPWSPDDDARDDGDDGDGADDGGDLDDAPRAHRRARRRPPGPRNPDEDEVLG